MLLRSNTHSSLSGGKKIVQAKAAPLEVGKPYGPHPQRRLTNVNRNGTNAMQ
jgi:hypothetical protein